MVNLMLKLQNIGDDSCMGRMKDIAIDNYGNEFCRYSYYGLGILRCSYQGLEGYECIGRKNCIHFEFCDLEID